MLVNLADRGHCVIDIRERAALDIVKATYEGVSADLPARADKLDSTPGGLGVRLLIWGIAAAAVARTGVACAVPRTVQRVTAS